MYLDTDSYLNTVYRYVDICIHGESEKGIETTKTHGMWWRQWDDR